MNRASLLELAHRLMDPLPVGREIYVVGPVQVAGPEDVLECCFDCGRYLKDGSSYRAVILRKAGTRYGAKEERLVHVGHFSEARRSR